MQEDYYRILNTTKDASQKQIKEAYRKLALEYHPDRNRETHAAAKMKEINEAYAVLSNPDKRREYDTLEQAYGSSAHSRFRQHYSEQDIFRDSDIRQVFEEISRIFDTRGFDEIFKEFYGPGYQTFEFRRPGVFARGFTFRPQAGRGRMGTNPYGMPLGGAFGKGLKYLLKKKWGVEWPEKGKDLNDQIAIPPDLASSGGKIRYLCRMRPKELHVTIPPNVRNGQRIRLRGMGHEGKGGGEPGNLYLTIRIRKPLFQTIRDWLRRIFSR